MVYTHCVCSLGTVQSASSTERPRSNCCCGVCPTFWLSSSNASPSGVSSGGIRSMTWWTFLSGKCTERVEFPPHSHPLNTTFVYLNMKRCDIFHMQNKLFTIKPSCSTWYSECTHFHSKASNILLSARNLDLSKFCIGQKDEMQQPPIYDLYAVINHYGGMIGGHYTAYARLPSDKNSQRSDVGECVVNEDRSHLYVTVGQSNKFHIPPWLSCSFRPLLLTSLPFLPTGWRLFDDSTVTMVEESQVVTRYAYVLFYRRRNSPVERPPRFLRPVGAESPTAAGATASQVRAPQR